MPYVSPAAQSSGAVAPATWAAAVKAGLDFQANPPACRVGNSANQSIPNTGDSVVTFNTEAYDTDGMHSTVTNTSRITLNTAGLYEVIFHGAFTPGNDYTSAWCYLRVNGSTVIAPGVGGRSIVGAVALWLMVSTVWKFAAGDYVEVLVGQRNSAAAARNLEVQPSYSPVFMATWIGLG